jgi:hypothetical protein
MQLRDPFPTINRIAGILIHEILSKLSTHTALKGEQPRRPILRNVKADCTLATGTFFVSTLFPGNNMILGNNIISCVPDNNIFSWHLFFDKILLAKYYLNNIYFLTYENIL